MGQFNMVFQRYEKKYMLKGKQFSQVFQAISKYMKVDEYGKSTICNIYYDTPQYDLVTRSIEKPVYKEKLRLRSYGVPKDEQTVFLELKKKYDGIVYKRRIPLTLREARESIEQRRIMGDLADTQIAKELNYVLGRYQLMPSTYLAYDRIAMYGREDDSIRVTFDFRIRSRQTDMDLSMGDEGTLLIPENQALMEIKVGDAYPFWLIRILEDAKVTPVSFSKYGTVYQNQIFPQLCSSRKTKAVYEGIQKQSNQKSIKAVRYASIA